MILPIIEVNNLSKKYEITHWSGGYVALRDIMGNALRDPISALKYRLKSWTGKISKEEFWALKDINFTVNRGEAIGVIGSNGAGKSTLLKIMTKITPPTSGEIILRGKVSSLLEVGTGFHPELTGRENILLNGAILGMTQKEIVKKFDQIVNFSGIEKFLDTPVKRYSSGMYVRLAFSVAAHMEPDILLVDEVLAVGDVAFQKKCLGKMDEVTRMNGRTVLFVSHNMNAIQTLCTRCILLDQGRVSEIGPTKDVIEKYLKSSGASVSLETRNDRKHTGIITLTSFYVESLGKKSGYLKTGGDYTFCLGYKTKGGKNPKNVVATISFFLDNGVQLAALKTTYTGQNFKTLPVSGVVKCHMEDPLPFAEGIYQVAVAIACEGGNDSLKNAGVIEVRKGDFFKTGVTELHGPVYLPQNWSFQTVKL